MDKDDANTITQFLERITPGHRNAIQVTHAMSEDQQPKATLEFTQTITPPVRMESPARRHVFFNAAGFIQYLKDNRTAAKKTLLLIDPESLHASAVLDDAAPQGFEVISFDPPFHPQFKVIQSIFLKTQSTRDFANAAMRCRNSIVAVNGNASLAGSQLAMLLKQITVSNQVTLEAGVGNGAVNGVLVTTSVKSGPAAFTQIDLPEGITLRTPIFLTGKDVSLEVQITVVPQAADKVAVCAEVPDLEVIIATEFNELLVGLSDIEGVQVSYGLINHKEWDYCK